MHWFTITSIFVACGIFLSINNIYSGVHKISNKTKKTQLSINDPFSIVSFKKKNPPVIIANEDNFEYKCKLKNDSSEVKCKLEKLIFNNKNEHISTIKTESIEREDQIKDEGFYKLTLLLASGISNIKDNIDLLVNNAESQFNIKTHYTFTNSSYSGNAYYIKGIVVDNFYLSSENEFDKCKLINKDDTEFITSDIKPFEQKEEYIVDLKIQDKDTKKFIDIQELINSQIVYLKKKKSNILMELKASHYGIKHENKYLWFDINN